MRPNGWRKPTPGLQRAEQFAQAGEQMAVPKARAIVAVKKVAVALGLKAQDMLLLDTFAAVTQPQDWEEGRRPIVWASNNFLIEQTGFALTTLRRHIRRLSEAGVIAMKDSPNGKRWGRRDRDGVIVEAYGFDLSPLAARTEEFEALHAQREAERAECAGLRNAITVTRRMIRAQIEQALDSGLSGPWAELKDAFAAMMRALPKRGERAGGLGRYLTGLRDLMRAVERSVAACEDAPQVEQQCDQLAGQEAEPAPRGPENGTHIQTTNKPEFVICNRPEPRQATPDAPEGQGCDRAENRPEMALSTLISACPTFAEMAQGLGGRLRNWTDLHRAAARLRPMVGISEEAWNTANAVLGPVQAAMSVALILDKTTAGDIRSPGGYLLGLVQRAQAGELHLSRSIHGRLRREAV